MFKNFKILKKDKTAEKSETSTDMKGNLNERLTE